MANILKEGERIEILVRDQSPEDLKNRNYYTFWGGLTGVIYRIYADGKAAVQVDNDALPDVVIKRHIQAQERMKKRWVDSLSDEARNRLTPEEKQFKLKYMILVDLGDLVASSRMPLPKEQQKRKSSADLDRAEAQYLNTPPEPTF